MKIATTTSDFHDYIPGANPAQTIRTLAQCGFSCVDLSLSDAFFPESPMMSDGWENWVDGIRRAADESHVELVQAHASNGALEDSPNYADSLAGLRRELKICQMLGIPGIVIHAVFRTGMERDEFMEANTRFYKTILNIAEETGVMIYTENTCQANCKYYHIFTGNDANELIDHVGNHPLFGCCWDVGHANVEHVNQYKSLVALGRNLKAIHVHDNDGNADQHLQPYAGNVCYDAILMGLKDNGFKGPFTLEAFSLPTPQTFYFCRRPNLTLNGKVYDALKMLPLEFKLQSETNMLAIARHMLKTYGLL